MLNRIELEVIDAYLDAPYGSPAADEALGDLISFADARRQQFYLQETKTKLRKKSYYQGRTQGGAE